MKATAKAPANIAFIKFWGKKDETLRLPLNDSFSMNLDGAYTTTTVEFDQSFERDDIDMVGDSLTEKETSRIVQHIDRIRGYVNMQMRAKVRTNNSFPKGTGAASSASGFAALTVAAFASLKQNVDEKTLTQFSRLASGSACRSIPDGFVTWVAGDSPETSVAKSVYTHSYWDICDVLVVVSTAMKKVSTTEGHENAQTSPFIGARIGSIPDKMKHIMSAMDQKNFALLGEIIEEDCLNMHAVMMTQNPPLLYWNTGTIELMHAVRQWRDEGVDVFYTMDAGPNVHLICQAKDERRVIELVRALNSSWAILPNKPAGGTALVDSHLF